MKCNTCLGGSHRLVLPALLGLLVVLDTKELLGAQKQASFSPHPADVQLAISPDGKTLATFGADDLLKLWDLATGRNLATVGTDTRSTPSNLAFSPDGKTLAVAVYYPGGEKPSLLKVWDAATGQQRRAYKTESRIRSVAFSPDGKYLATGGSAPAPGDQQWPGEIKFLDLNSWQEQHIVNAHASSVYSVAFSPDGALLASASTDKTVKLWQMPKRQEQVTLRHKDMVYRVTFSPDGKSLATAGLAPGEKGPAEIKLWDVTTAQQRLSLTGPASGVYALVFAPDGKTLASGGMNNSVKLHDTATGKPRNTFQWPGQFWISSLAFTPDGKTLIIASWDGIVQTRDVDSGREKTIFK